MSENDSQVEELLQQAATGDGDAKNALFEMYRDRLKRMIRVRMNRRVSKRVDDSDVLQDAYLEASRRLEEYLDAPRVSFFLWIRQITRHKIIDVHRKHLGAEGRDARLEVSMNRSRNASVTSFSLAEHLMANCSTPSTAVRKKERREALERAIADLDEMDQEIISLRHFEQLSNGDAARELGIDPSTASKRFLRALKRLQQILDDLGMTPQGRED